MSYVEEIRHLLQSGAERADALATELHGIQNHLDEVRAQMRELFEGSQSAEVSRAHDNLGETWTCVESGVYALAHTRYLLWERAQQL
ncbi:hypothetical protein [Saccharomonospora iraqiensis]|uniref:hypothetical protein n=1 Tax=Saccharomonospora iraqiensis TaxID=52698 RepID=UPI0004060DE8|nr:hypothetical protein [Saccharomonospora iraqiensis]